MQAKRTIFRRFGTHRVRIRFSTENRGKENQRSELRLNKFQFFIEAGL